MLIINILFGYWFLGFGKENSIFFYIWYIQSRISFFVEKEKVGENESIPQYIHFMDGFIFPIIVLH